MTADEIKNNPTDTTNENFDMPPHLKAPMDHPLVGKVIESLKSVHDPELPVNIFELGLIYQIDITADSDVLIVMTLTSPQCPIAETMPMMVETAVSAVPGVRLVEVNLVWEPMWNPSFMAETAKLQVGMF